jgi:hypothetical protein
VKDEDTRRDEGGTHCDDAEGGLHVP